MSKGKPTFEEVLSYAKPILAEFINKFAGDFPREHKEEMEQECAIRLFQAFSRLEADKGWKSFTYNHCRGTVLDYLKFGRGYAEGRASLHKEETSRSKNKLRERAYYYDNESGESLEVEHVAAINGVYHTLKENRGIRWDLVARLASSDEVIHAGALWINDLQYDEIAHVLALSKHRVAQLISEFFERFDDPEKAEDPNFLQMLYALNLCEEFGLPDEPQPDMFTVCLPKIDLFKKKERKPKQPIQLTFFPMMEEDAGFN